MLIRPKLPAPAPNRKWIADFTYVWTAEGWLYVAAVVDLFSRRVVGWSIKNFRAKTAQLTDVDGDRNNNKPNVADDESSRAGVPLPEEFPSVDLADYGICSEVPLRQCLGARRWRASFCRSLKTKAHSTQTYRTRDEAKADVFDYIEYFYNPKRGHSTLGYLTPVEFEIKVGLA